jgi:hypothetical protein
MEEVGSSEVDSSRVVSLLEKVMLVLLAVEVGERVLSSCHQGGFSAEESWRVPSRLVPSRRILGHAVKAGAGS